MDDARIEKVARKICSGLGLDPDQEVTYGYGDTMTPAEREENLRGSIPDIALFGHRWMLYRATAAEAIAAQDALQGEADG